MRPRRAVIGWCWLLAAVVLAGCAAEQEADTPEVATTPAVGVTTSAAPGASTPVSPDAPAGPEVPEALDFTLPALDGGQVVGAELAGRAVALWFWTPW